MPPIQVPTISAQNEQPLHAPRLDQSNLNPVAPMQQDTAAVEKVADQAIKLRNNIADQTADTTATNAKNQYLLWRKKKLYGDPESGEVGLINKQGNPTDLYQAFDKEQGDYLDGLAKSPGDQNWAQETQNVVNRRLSLAYEESQLETLTQYAHQQKKYDDNNSDAAVTLAQNGMPIASTYIKPGEDTTFGPMDAKIAAIRNARIAQAIRYGNGKVDDNGDTAYTAPDGSKQAVNLGLSAKAKIAGDVSTGLYDTIVNLVHSKDLEKAEAMRERYSGMLDAEDSAKLDTQMEKGKTKQEAFDLADLARTKGIGVIQNYDDPEVRHEALKIFTQDNHYVEAERQRKSKTNFDALSNYVQSVQRSDHPFTGTVALENDPKFLKLIDNITDSKQKQAIYHQVDQPKNSSQASSDKIQDLFFGKDPNHNIREVSDSDFNLYLGGLDKSDQKFYSRKRFQLKTQNGPQLEQQYKLFGSEFDRQAVGAELLHRLPNSQYFVPSDQIRDAQYKKELLDTIENLGPTTPTQRSEYIAKFVADKKAGIAFQPPPIQKFNSGANNAPPSAPPSTTQAPAPQIDTQKYYGALTPAARLQYIIDYKKDKKTTVAPNTQQLVDYIQGKLNNK